MTEYCEEHYRIISDYATLKTGQENIYRDVQSINRKMDEMMKSIGNGKIDVAIMKTKSGILYWTIMVLVIAGISGMMNYLWSN